MENKTVYYALFNAHPSSQPPFRVELGTGKDTVHNLDDCKDIPDSIARIEAFCKDNSFALNPSFVLLYPIYMDAMDTEFEGTMHQIAWLIKDQADVKKWNFDRIGGYTGNTTSTFVH